MIDRNNDFRREELDPSGKNPSGEAWTKGFRIEPRWSFLLALRSWKRLKRRLGVSLLSGRTNKPTGCLPTTSQDPAESTTVTQPVANPSSKDFGLATTEARSFYLYAKQGKHWRLVGKLKWCPSNAIHAVFLRILFEGKKEVSIRGLLALLHPNLTMAERRRDFKSRVKPAVSKLRRSLRTQLNLTDKDDPFPYVNGAWTTTLTVGYMEEGEDGRTYFRPA
jgi:hypothetical protein